MATLTEWISPASVVEVSHGDNYTWTNVSNAETPDSIYATAYLENASGITNYAKATDYDFGLPVRAVIRGILANIKKYNVCDPGASVVDESVILTAAGSNNKASVNAWPASATDVSYGGATDKWGATLTRSIVSASTFGLQLAATLAAPGEGYTVTAYIDAMQLKIAYDEVIGDWTHNESDLTTVVDATDITLNGGSITGYDWNWGDETSHGSGSETSHEFSENGTYTVTLTITVNTGETFTYSKSITVSEEVINMAAITKVTPFVVKRGAALTIVGTALSTATSGVSIVGAGVTITSLTTQTETTYIATVPTSASLALQSVTLMLGTTVQASASVYIGSTDAFNKAELLLGKMSRLYINGTHVGYLEDTVELQPSQEVFDYKSNDSGAIQKTFVISSMCNLRMTISQCNVELLAKILNGTYAAADNSITLTGDPSITDYTVGFTDAAGVSYYLPVCNVIEPANVVLRATQNQGFSISMRALPDANNVTCKMWFPATA